MTWSFGDSFDLYAAIADMVNGYWDSAGAQPGFLVAGRFAGSQALSMNNVTVNYTKSSGVNDAVHHLVVSYRQTVALSGTTSGAYLELWDGTTAQCSVVFRSDGAILLVSGGPTGATLATYTGAVAAINTWYAFEFEVVINNTTGSFAVRKNGNTVNDFSATALNTRPTSTNNYANKLTIGMQATVNAQQFDDLFWRSDAASVAWLGDIRCYARMPASDQSIQFSRLSTISQTAGTATTNANVVIGTARLTLSMTMQASGTISNAAVTMVTGYSGNMKCAIWSSVANAPAAVLATATPIVNPVNGANTFTFPSPLTVAQGQVIIVGFISDTASGQWSLTSGTSGFVATGMTYSSFPQASPTIGVGQASPVVTVFISPTANNSMVNESQEDGATSYVFDSNVNDADFYGIAAIGSTPATIIATVTRGYMQKSDAGTRTAAVQVKSGATTVASPTLVLTTSGWLWAWRMDLTDPATGAAWTATGVNNVQVGPKVIA